MRIRLPRLSPLLLLAAMLAAPPAAGQEADPEEALTRLFEAEAANPDWFAPAFLQQVPIEEVDRLVGELRTRHGPLLDVRPTSRGHEVALEGAEIPATITLDAQGRIAGLFLEAAIPTGGTLDSLAIEITELEGDVALLIVSDGEVRVAHRAEEPLAVGSAAKLLVLRAVDQAVSSGDLAWEQVVALEEGWRSLPTGILQDWPAETPVTIATLANLMISISDNTATDALIDLVGRGTLEAMTPRNMPFLTTRELFVLKGREAEPLREAWRAADDEGRAAQLDDLAVAALPAALDADTSIDIEWFLTAAELCAALEDVAALPAVAINPGLAEPGVWESVAFKGGSEAGVLNLSTRLIAPDGTTHCVVATWNAEAALDETALVSPYRAILRALAPPPG